MSVSKQTGWSNESNLLYEILQEIKRLQSIVTKLTVTTVPATTTTTTTHV